ncbi:hypothetical protein GA0070612_3503 [Micromonospora chokoriensis]|uniref:Uncharacterized protein n=1 Tax=Micromonospora chokoriensis TaxID=356851 RepID=A0A1C4XEF9_9ACTN|nr:hypothetical protein GA0070612_3503 [Micromonospora chokoriensis]
MARRVIAVRVIVVLSEAFGSARTVAGHRSTRT